MVWAFDRESLQINRTKDAADGAARLQRGERLQRRFMEGVKKGVKTAGGTVADV